MSDELPNTEAQGDGARSSGELPYSQHSQDPLEAASAAAAGVDGAGDVEEEQAAQQNVRRELTETDCESELGYAFPSWKKWWILTVMFLVQLSMNFNASLYSTGISSLAEEFDTTHQVARYGAALFLVFYAVGCELWAPWSDELGRKRVLQWSLSLINVATGMVGGAPNVDTVLAGRSLGGLATAGGCVTLGLVADLYDSDNQQYAIAFIVFSSVFGSVLGPIVGGFIQLLPRKEVWRWCAWVQLSLGVVVQKLHFFTVPETRATMIVDRVAKSRRQTGSNPDVYGPGEMRPLREPPRMLYSEPIVLWLSLLSGLADAVIFIQIQAIHLVYKQWNFNSWQTGLSFVPIAIGYLIAWGAFIVIIQRNRRQREEEPFSEYAQFESRLCLLPWVASCLPIGLLIFGWTSFGPPIPWIAPMIGTFLIGIANYGICIATIDYLICVYGRYSASAAGANGMVRNLLAGICTFFAVPFFKGIDSENDRTFAWASTILALAASVLAAAACYVYVNAPSLRRKSSFARHRASRDGESQDRRISLQHRSLRAMIDEILKSARHAQHGQDAQQSQNAQRPAEAQGAAPAMPIHIPGRRHSNPPTQGPVPSPMPSRPTFGSSAPHGSYMASVHAASRRRNRQASRNASVSPRGGNDH
ncbi:major facilitator superfamily domain-containing protein [Nemania sp. NC0429]|nr:major facilitator superfamily domain-containing protein [Nemania sp. NC0429]